MPLILNIDTATENASVCLSKDGQVVAIESNTDQKAHASFIQPAIQRLFERAGYDMALVDAIAVSNGPGSYTGLRVGLSTAKGLCYALQKPLILINTLEVMATAAIQNVSELSSEILFCPMIDARRMEVFAAVYDQSLREILPPAPMILDEYSFIDLLQRHTMIFSGSGAEKFEKIASGNKIKFLYVKHDASHMQTLSEKMYLLKSFADKAYSEPYYLKEFFTTQQKIKSD